MFSLSKMVKDSTSVIVSKTITRIVYLLMPLICMVSLLYFTGCTDEAFRSESVGEYSKRLEQKLNKDLSDPNNAVRRRVESAHGTVDVTSAYISKIRIVTKDGSDNAGVDGSNVSEVHVNIMTYWDGIFHKDGYTEFYANIDMASGQPKGKKAGIVRTNAWINMEDPEFWLSVAGCLILLI